MVLNVHICIGKTTFFAPNQANVDAPPPEKLSETEKECAAIEEQNGELAARMKTLSAGMCIFGTVVCTCALLTFVRSELAKVRSTPTDETLSAQITVVEVKVRAASFPYQSTPLTSSNCLGGGS